VADFIGVDELFDADDFYKLLFRLVVNLFFTTIVVRGVYARLYGRNSYVFTYFLFNVITFTLCFTLRKVPVELGFALGLFAVFGILRYRTEPIRTRDLTYLFIVIGLAILNAVANRRVSLAELMLVNVVVVGLTLLLEYAPFSGREQSQEVTYDDLELLRREDKTALMEDLRKRTGLDVHRIAIERLDLLRDTASITVFYRRRR